MRAASARSKSVFALRVLVQPHEPPFGGSEHPVVGTPELLMPVTNQTPPVARAAKVLVGSENPLCVHPGSKRNCCLSAQSNSPMCVECTRVPATKLAPAFDVKKLPA